MAVSVEVRGTAEFRELARRLKEAGDGRLVRDLRRGMRAAANPAKEEAQRTVRSVRIEGVPLAETTRPRRRTRGSGRYARYEHQLSRSRKVTERARVRAAGRSGLREAVAHATGIEVNASPKSARVRIRCRRSQMPADQRKLPMYINKGHWRHPVRGNTDVWVEQLADPAWFDDTVPKAGPACREAAAQVVNDITDKIAR